jgi:GGDEF domain-containing protein
LPDGGVVRTISDVSERKRKEMQIAHMASHDALTNLANRTLLNEDLFKAADAALNRAKSDGGNAYDFFGRVTQASPLPVKLQQAV